MFNEDGMLINIFFRNPNLTPPPTRDFVDEVNDPFTDDSDNPFTQ